MVASYLLYDWLQNEFDGNSNPDSEDPVILKISADKETIYTGDMVTLEVEAEDNQDSASDLEYFWFASAGTMASPTSSITIWNAPDDPGTVTVSVIVTDTDGNKDSATVEIEVIE
jgi:phage tail sheath gpL-like